MQFFPLAALLVFAVFDRPPARWRARAGWLAVRSLWLARALGGLATVLWTSGLEADAFPPPLVAGRAGEPPACGLAKPGR